MSRVQHVLDTVAKCAHVTGIFVSCMSSVPRAFVRTSNSRAALTIHTKLFIFTCVKRVHACMHVCTHAYVKFKVSGTVSQGAILGKCSLYPLNASLYAYIMFENVHVGNMLILFFIIRT